MIAKNEIAGKENSGLGSGLTIETIRTRLSKIERRRRRWPVITMSAFGEKIRRLARF